MSVSRRNLLRNSLLAAVAYAASPLRGWSANKARPANNQSQSNVNNVTLQHSAALQHLDRTAFTEAVGSSFRVSPTSGKASPVYLRLMTVENLPALAPVNEGAMAVPPKQGKPVPATSGFILSFLGTMPERLPQGTYTFEHAGLGTFSLLIVPGPAGDQTYHAVINRVQ